MEKETKMQQNGNGEIRKKILKLKELDEKVQEMIAFLEAILRDDMNHDKSRVQEQKTYDDNALKEKIEYHLFRMGISYQLSGTLYLEECIAKVVKNPISIKDGRKLFYSDIAKKYDSSIERIDRAIRYAICVGMEKCDRDILSEYFTNIRCNQNGTPYINDFIGVLANKVRIEIE